MSKRVPARAKFLGSLISTEIAQELQKGMELAAERALIVFSVVRHKKRTEGPDQSAAATCFETRVPSFRGANGSLLDRR